MTSHPMQDEVKVTQADRDAAADLYLALDGGSVDPSDIAYAETVRKGRCDDSAAVQAFARHRHQAEQRGGEEHAAKLAECLAKACGDIAALLIFGNREGDIRPWTAEYAAVLNAYDGQYEAPAYPRPSWQGPIHADDCEAMQRPRADCTCVPIARQALGERP